ncbi:MAG TPA: hypothetical protein VLD84_07050 [Nitrososphaeraceae archaeon]|nr:hypothetical protein [Nitrososphaeraceae archaeon]
MELDITAKDKHALKSLSVDLRDMLRMKKVDDRVDNPEYRRVFDASFFKVTEGNYLDEMLNWIEDFSNRIADAEGEQSKDELNLETKKLIDAGWIRPRGYCMTITRTFCYIFN